MQQAFQKAVFPFDVKVSETPGRFTGRASVYGVVDFQGDVVMPGAFTRTLKEKGGRIKVLNHHDASDVIGMAELTDSDTALMASGELVLDLVSAKDAHTRLQHKLIDGISIGFSLPPGGSVWDGNVRKLTDVDLWEISLVTFPACDFARVTSVKQAPVPLTRADVEKAVRDGVVATDDILTWVFGADAKTVIEAFYAKTGTPLPWTLPVQKTVDISGLSAALADMKIVLQTA